MSSWTNPQHFERCKALYIEGKSMNQIAAALNREFPDASYSRNAVIGKLNRALPCEERYARPSPPAKVAKPPGPPKAPKPERPRVFIAGKNQVRIVKEAPPPKVEIKVAAFEPLPGSTPRPWLHRSASMCCWPVGGEGESTLYCCEPVHKRGWCAHHHGRGTTPLPAKASTPKEMYRSLRRHVA